MMKRLSAIMTTAFISLSLLSAGCDKPEEKAPAPSTTKQTMQEQVPAAIEKVKEQAGHVVEEVKEKTEQVVEEAKKITAETVEAAKEAGEAMKETGAEMMDKASDKVNELTQSVNQEPAPASETAVQQEVEKKALDLKKSFGGKLIEGC
jgi:hypothetical protein